MDVNIPIDSNLNMNEQNIKSIVEKLSNKYSNQNIFIQIFKDTLISANLGDKNAIIKLEKITQIMPNAIRELGLPFCTLLNEDNDIINYYINNFIQGEDAEASKNILINYIQIFNFKSNDANPIDKLLEKLKNTSINIKEIQNSKRITKSIIENFYDELNQCYNNWKTTFKRNIGEDEYYYKQLKPVLKEKEKKIQEIESQNLFPIATIMFLKEKIQSIKDLNEKIIQGDINFENNQDNQIMTKQENGNNTRDIHENGLTEEEKNKLKEIELKKGLHFT